MPLFNKRLIASTVTNYRVEINSELKARLQEHFKTTLHRIEAKTFGKEESEKVTFLQKMFELLGYKMHENLEFEYSMQGRSIDAVLGPKIDVTANPSMPQKTRNVEVAIEWKGIDTKNLDKGKAGETPVSQLWDYITKSGSPVGILGNFLEFRLYVKSKKQSDYHEFKLVELVGENSNAKLDELIVLLNPKSLLRGENKINRIENLIEQAQSEQEQITKRFYSDYKTLRLHLYQDLVSNNSQLSKHFVLEKTQKLLDRLVFVMFCEDTGLLPSDIIKTTYEQAKNDRSRSPTKIWEQFQYLFDDIDKGRHDIYPQINAFNGGLFKSDVELNQLIIQSGIWQPIVKLAEYDFASDLNVNILGHIFEQSISDLEDIKAQIEATEVVTATTVSPQDFALSPQDCTPQAPTPKAKTSKRKKDGIYYTPEYITDYIVEQTVGKYLSENPGSLETITVLDPAGGSGAFPNQVHNFLAKQHADIFNQTVINNGFDVLAESDEILVDKSILKNNIFMVDIQPESVEIAKLSLWLKTARKNQKLDNLDSNIKCGNSLIDDKEVAGELAFDWNASFPNVMANGGFDVIVGNPPYVAIKNQDQKTREYISKSYEYSGGADLYVAFIEKGLKLLKPGGYLGFICPIRFFTTSYGKKVRNELQFGDYDIVSIWDLKDEKVFEDATIKTIVLIIKKGKIRNVTIIKNQENERLVLNIFNEEGTIQIDQDEESQLQIDKMNLHPKLLSFADARTGIMGFEYWKMEKIISEKNTQSTVRLYTNGNIGRYEDNWENKRVDLYKNKYHKPTIELNPEFLNNNTIELFKIKPKILVRGIATKLNAIIDRNGSGLLVAVHSVIPKENLNINFLLAVLNSKIIDWYHKKRTSAGKIEGGYYKFSVNDLKTLPIPNSTPEQQTEIEVLVNRIMNLKMQFSKYLDNTFTLLQAELAGSSPILPTINRTKNLTKFTELDFTTFLTELTKQKYVITATTKRTLLESFEIDRARLVELQTQINAVDNQIENLVRGLYGVEGD